MRYFNESITGNIITDPDLEHGEITLYDNNITLEYVTEDNKPKGHYEIVKENKEKNSKIVEWVADKDVVGEWKVFDKRGGVKREVDNDDIIIPEDLDISLIFNSVETVGIYHEFTEEEQEEHDEQVAENEARITLAENKQNFLDDMFDEKDTIEDIISDVKGTSIGGSLDDYADSVDLAITEIWETIRQYHPISKNDNIIRFPGVAHAYARLIKKGIKSLDDISDSEMREEVRKILEEENK